MVAIRAEIIDFLVLSGDLLDRLSPKARRILGERLEAGDYTAVREAARIMANLAAALEIEARWRGAEVPPSFHRLLTSIRNLADRPLDARRRHPDLADEVAPLGALPHDRDCCRARKTRAAAQPSARPLYCGRRSRRAFSRSPWSPLWMRSGSHPIARRKRVGASPGSPVAERKGQNCPGTTRQGLGD
jgi:hypothetical protein